MLTIPPLKTNLLTGTTNSKTGFTPEDIWLQMRIMPTKIIVKTQWYQPTLHRSGRGLMRETGVKWNTFWDGLQTIRDVNSIYLLAQVSITIYRFTSNDSRFSEGGESAAKFIDL